MAAEWQFRTFGSERGPWRATRAEALQDAKAVGEAAYDEQYRCWFTGAGTKIAWREVEER